MTKTRHNRLVARGCITLGFILLIALPTEYKEWAGVAINLIWLWRT